MIVLAGLGLMVSGVVLGVWLVRAFGDGGNELEAIKTAGTIVIGAGGTAALYLTARRQRSNELALRQKELDQEQAGRVHRLQVRIAADTKAHHRAVRDGRGPARRRQGVGAARRFVRLARLAQDSPGQRQTIVNVLCAPTSACRVMMRTGLGSDRYGVLRNAS